MVYCSIFRTEGLFVVFSGLTFLLLFLPLLLGLYFVSRSIRWRNGILVVFSLIFYAWGEPVMVLLLVLTTLINFLCALAMEKAASAALKKLWLGVGVAVSLAGLFYFKYSGLFVSTVCSILSVPMTFSAPRLPIGISFYTFQILTYTIDVYRKKVPLQRNFWKLLLYVSCFPQLIAGPIVQYGDVYGALDARTVSADDFTEGMRRFFVGLGKKVLLANPCGSFLLAVLPEGAAAQSVTAAWLGSMLYALQLYFDFSAYSDMAIGLGRVLGFSYKENFRYPYCSVTPSDFWRRWHISLGSFFREYVYIPLGGSRCGRVRRILNLLIVWALTGLWHGASWNYMLWGVYWFVILVLDKGLDKFLGKIPKALRFLLTTVLILIGLAVFYNTDMSLMGAHLAAMFGGGSAGWIDPQTVGALKKYALFLPAALVAATPVVPLIKRLTARAPRLFDVLGTVVSVLIGFVSLLFLVQQSYNPFIYFRF